MAPMAFLHYFRDPWSRVPAMKIRIEEFRLPFHHMSPVLDRLLVSYLCPACQGKFKLRSPEFPEKTVVNECNLLEK